MKLEDSIEAVLLWRGEPVKVVDLARSLDTTEEKVTEALKVLADRLTYGVRLVREGGRVALATMPEAAPVIERLRKEELEGPLGKAGLETLSVIVFDGPVSRADIEYVRGVNCSSILRTLAMRGLIERIDNPNDKRGYLYRASIDLPATLGVPRLEDIPGYGDMRESLRKVRETAVTAPNHVVEEA